MTLLGIWANRVSPSLFPRWLCDPNLMASGASPGDAVGRGHTCLPSSVCAGPQACGRPLADGSAGWARHVAVAPRGAPRGLCTWGPAPPGGGLGCFLNVSTTSPPRAGLLLLERQSRVFCSRKAVLFAPLLSFFCCWKKRFFTSPGTVIWKYSYEEPRRFAVVCFTIVNSSAPNKSFLSRSPRRAAVVCWK